MGYGVLSGRTEFCCFLDTHEAPFIRPPITRPHHVRGLGTLTHSQLQGPAAALVGQCHPTVAPPSGSATLADPPPPPSFSPALSPDAPPSACTHLRKAPPPPGGGGGEISGPRPRPRPRAASLHHLLAPSSAMRGQLQNFSVPRFPRLQVADSRACLTEVSGSTKMSQST